MPKMGLFELGLRRTRVWWEGQCLEEPLVGTADTFRRLESKWKLSKGRRQIETIIFLKSDTEEKERIGRWLKGGFLRMGATKQVDWQDGEVRGYGPKEARGWSWRLRGGGRKLWAPHTSHCHLHL